MTYSLGGVWEQHRNAVERTLENTGLTGPQRLFLNCEAPVSLWRDANQVGKSLGLALDIVMFCRGDHPKQTHRPPVNVLVAGDRWEQMVGLMEKVWSFCPKSELDPRHGFDPGRGITGKPPRLVFTSGPGKGSVISFATFRQSAARIAGATLHRAVLDEPCPESFYGEVLPRVFRYGGRIRMGFTPTLAMAPVDYLKDKVADGEIVQHNYGLSEANCWPDNQPWPWTTTAEIAEFEAKLLPLEREQRMGRSWDPLITGRLMDDYGNENVRAFGVNNIAGAFLAVGTDHGAVMRPGKQSSVLVAMQRRGSRRPRAYVIDEAVAEGLTTPEHDAAAILEMLARRGLSFDDVDLFVGDVATGSKKHEIRKSNADLRREMAAQLGRRTSKMPRWLGPKKWGGSMSAGARQMNTMAKRRNDADEPDLIVHPRCKMFHKACLEFNGDPNHVLKDVWDAGRYAIERSIGHVQALPRLKVLY